MIKQITDYLYKYSSLWFHLSFHNLSYADITLDELDDMDYYGVNFSGNKKVFQLFFSGSDDFFSCFWIGNDTSYKSILDQIPIYQLDLSSDQHTFKTEGNFRSFMTEILDNFLNKNSKEDKYYFMALSALIELKQFSSETIHQRDYILKIN
jgi:hypothetical protein